MRPISHRRRRLLGALAGATLAWPLRLRAESLPPTPACESPAEATPRQTAGPFYRPDAPQRQDLREADSAGPALALSGRVLTPDCRPLAGAVLEFWQADSDGRYDRRGHRWRGYQQSADGDYRLLTVVPGRYPGRTRHLHVRIGLPQRGVLLTTQLYFPDEPANARDFLFDPALLMAYARVNETAVARYDFVVPL